MIDRLSSNRLIRHLLFWVGITLLAGSFYIAEDIGLSNFSFRHPVVIFSYLFLARLPTFLIYTYLLAYKVFPLVSRGHYIRFVGELLLLNLAVWFLHDLLLHSLQYPLAHWLHQELFHEFDSWLFSSSGMGSDKWIMNTTAGLFICIKLFAQWQQQQAESQRLEREKLQAELQLLKLQLNPAFLFSTLDALQPLIWQQDSQAPEVVLKLAHFLRYVLYDSQPVVVPVVQEITAIEQFVFLHQIIHPVGLEVSMTTRGRLSKQSVASLSLLPIVENAFNQLKTGRTDEPAWVSIDLFVSETNLTMKVISGQQEQTNYLNQLGGIRKQLYFHYGDAYTLQILPEPDAFIVTLTVPVVTTFGVTPESQHSIIHTL